LKEVFYTSYLERRLELRHIPSNLAREILEKSIERYFDNETNRFIKIGKAKIKNVKLTLSVIYEETEEEIIVVTVHSITRQ